MSAIDLRELVHAELGNPDITTTVQEMNVSCFTGEGACQMETISEVYMSVTVHAIIAAETNFIEKDSVMSRLMTKPTK